MNWLRDRLRTWLLSSTAVVEPVVPTPKVERKSLKISDGLLSNSKRKRQVVVSPVYKIGGALHPPGCAPAAELAMDSEVQDINAWAFANINAVLADGQTFLGYPLLAELAQRPEYRRITETIARHMTRKWIEFDVKSDDAGPGGDRPDEDEDEDEDADAKIGDDEPFAADLAMGPGGPPAEPKDEPAVGDKPDKPAEKSLAPDQDKLDKVAKIEEVLERIGAKAAFQKIAEHDGFYGRAHLYLDTGATDDPAELKTSLGEATTDDPTTEVKLKGQKGKLKKLKPIEAVWCYPTNYNSTDPLADDWYKPSQWFVMGKQVSATRLLTFVGREVPDILKPAYSFGGLAMSQMVRPYVENWINTRQAVADLIKAFSVFVLKTKLTDGLEQDGADLFKRVELFNNFRDNAGTFVIDKDEEDFANVSVSLGTLDKLQAQAQEQQASIAGIPIVLLLMITPSGLNASSEGEIQAFWDWVHSYQESFFRPNLTTVINLIQMTEFGEIDPDITWNFARLEGLNDLEWSQKELAQAQTDTAYCDAGILDPIEVRKALAADTQSRYHGLAVDDVPEPPEPELPPGMGAMLGAPGGGAKPGEPVKPGKPPAAVPKPAAAAKEMAG